MDQASLMVTGLKMMVALGFVLLVFGGALYVVKRFAGSSKGFLRKAGKSGLKPLEILSYQSLGPGRSLYLVRCLDKRVLVGATNQGISHIADIEEPLDAPFATSLEGQMGRQSDAKAGKQIKSDIETSLRDVSRV